MNRKPAASMASKSALTHRSWSACSWTARAPSQRLGERVAVRGAQSEVFDQAAERAGDLLAILGLGAAAEALVADYSRGMRKKLAIGCALIHGPKLLFLDEPFEGVDALSAETIRGVLGHLTARGTTVLLTTHILPLAERLCDTFGILREGRLAWEGDPRALAAEGVESDHAFPRGGGRRSGGARPAGLARRRRVTGPQKRDPCPGGAEAARDEPADPSRAGPGIATLVGELALLRVRLLGRRLGGTGWAGASLSALAMLCAAGGLGLGGYVLFSRVPVLHESRIWMAFFLALYFFLLGVFWILWPLVAAQVDDATELGRFLHYPIRPRRLYLVQTLSALLAPSAFFFYPALVGAGLGLSESLRPGALPTLLLMVCFALMCVAVGRALLNLFLNVMAHRRSAELLFSAVLVGLALAAVLPPVDASWLTARFAELADAAPEDLEDLRRAAHAMTDTPPGWIAHGLRAAARGYDATVLRTALGMLLVAGLAWGVGLWALLRFYRGARRFRWGRSASSAKGAVRSPRSPATPAPSRPRLRGGWRLPGLSGPVSALCERELRTLARSPKGRLLFAMPFFLVILLRLVGAAPLLAYWLGPGWTAQLLMALAVYVLGSLAGQFFVNQFGYDGQAVRLLYLLPPSPRDWLLGRNLAHGAFALGQIFALTLLVFAILPGVALQGLELPLLFFPVGLLVLLGVGNFLSVKHPRRFVFNLTRRDRPAAASFGFLLAALSLVLALVALVLGLAAVLGVPKALGLLGLGGLAVLLYLRFLPLAARELGRRREALVSGVIAS